MTMTVGSLHFLAQRLVQGLADGFLRHGGLAQ
jgi:hypothetical protein